VSRRTKGVFATQVVEDVHGIQKNTKQIRAQRCFRRPEFSMASVLKQKVLTITHRYDTPCLTTPLASQTDRLPPEAFRSVKSNCSLDFNKFVSLRRHRAGSARATPICTSPSATWLC
jgi:hypothetical protein